MKTEKNYSSLAKDNSQFTHPLTPSPHKGWEKISAVDIKNRKVAFTLAEGATHVALPKGYRRTAFTLAEVLITIGIIGVVAVLTIPSLIQNHQDKVTVTKIKQAYSLLSNAFMLAQNEYGTANNWDMKDKSTQEIVDLWSARIIQFLPIYEDCGIPRHTCYRKYGVTKLYNLNSSTGGLNSYAGREVILNNNMVFTFENFKQLEYNYYGFIVVDINGLKKPNMLGKDRFYFTVNVDKVWDRTLTPKIKAGYGAGSRPEYCLTGRYGLQGLDCGLWVTMYENLDYLHCKDKLLETGAHSCKDAK